MNRFFFSGFYDKDRLSGINEIKDIVNKYGFVIDFKMFSDVSMSLSVEIEERKIDALSSKLKEILKLDDFQNLNTESKNESLVLLNVTFNKGQGDLRRSAPAIPG